MARYLSVIPDKETSCIVLHLEITIQAIAFCRFIFIVKILDANILSRCTNSRDVR